MCIKIAQNNVHSVPHIITSSYCAIFVKIHSKQVNKQELLLYNTFQKPKVCWSLKMYIEVQKRRNTIYFININVIQRCSTLCKRILLFSFLFVYSKLCLFPPSNIHKILTRQKTIIFIDFFPTDPTDFSQLPTSPLSAVN